jgi:hypothetical protein
MRSLAELQSAMTRAVLSGDAAPLVAEITAPKADPLRRFAIYRNNTFLSLTRHLKAVFPVTARLGDERFFSYAAYEFIRRHPPREPRLASYGSSFAGFLAKFPPCRSAPILPAMASLEWAVHAALTSAEKTPIAPASLAEFASTPSGLRLVLQPSLNFNVARWPILPLWQGSHPNGEPLARRTTRLGVFRSGDRVRVHELPPARFAFWRSIVRGAALDHAAARGLARDPMFDVVDEILTLFRSGLVVATDNVHAH